MSYISSDIRPQLSVVAKVNATLSPSDELIENPVPLTVLDKLVDTLVALALFVATLLSKVSKSTACVIDILDNLVACAEDIVVVLPANAVVEVEPNCRVVTESPNDTVEPSIVMLELDNCSFPIPLI